MKINDKIFNYLLLSCSGRNILLALLHEGQFGGCQEVRGSKSALEQRPLVPFGNLREAEVMRMWVLE